MTKRKAVLELCGARRSRVEGTCLHPAGWGTDHAGVGRCKFHGGANPSGRKYAAKLAAAKALAELGEPVATDPIRGLADALAVSNGMVQALRALVSGLAGPTNDLGVHPLVALHGEWTDRLARIAKMGADVGLEARWQSIAEADGIRLGAVFRRALADEEAALDDRQRAALARAMARELRATEAPPWQFGGPPDITLEPAALPASTSEPKEGPA